MAKTEHGTYRFMVKDGADAETFFLAAEPVGNTIRSLDGGLLTFQLRKGTTQEEAQNLAQSMNQKISQLSFTIRRAP